MVFSCVLCLKETCYVHNFCETCEFIKRNLQRSKREREREKKGIKKYRWMLIIL